MTTLTTNDMLAIVTMMQMGLKTLNGQDFDQGLAVYTGISAKFVRMQQEVANPEAKPVPTVVPASEEKSAAG